MKAERIPKSNNYPHLTGRRYADTGTYHNALGIICSSCGAVEERPLTNGHSTCSQEFADRMFRNRGWTLGRSRKHDICPACTNKVKEGQVITASAGNVIAIAARKIEESIAPMQTSAAATIAAANLNKTVSVVAPREMSRTDKRIIFNKLEEVYVDENTGYSKGWNDQKVASDLGVPVDWVRSLRDENFGPEGHSPEARIVFDDVRKMIDELRAEREKLMAKANEMTALGAKLALEADRLDRKLMQIEKGKL